MAHARQQIREAVGTTITGLTTVGSSVFQSRVYPVKSSSDLPCYIVYTLKDSLDEPVMGDKRFRVLMVVVEAKVKTAQSNFDDELDLICAEAEAAIFADSTLGGLVKNIELVETTIELGDEAEYPVGVATMTFEARYRVDRTDPQTVIA
jgi:hypothetical protein